MVGGHTSLSGIQNMNKTAIALLICVVAAGNIITIALLLGDRDSGVAGREGGGADLPPLVNEIKSLRKDVDRLLVEVSRKPAPLVASSSDGETAPVTPTDGALATRLDEVLERLSGIEKNLAAMKEFNEELAVAKLREKRQEQFRAEDGYTVADELLAQKKFAVGANGILTFLESHPGHPDEQDLMRRARNGFRQSGYLDKALWLQGEIMEKFPEHRGGDLYRLATLENRMNKHDDAIRHLDESVRLATTDQERMTRLLYRAELVHQRDGDSAGLGAYREVERLARAAGVGNASEAGKRADRIEERLTRR